MKVTLLSRLWRHRALWVVLVLGLGLSGFGWFQVDAYVRQQNRTRFLYSLENLRSEIQDKINDLKELLYGAQVLFNASETVEPDEWMTFVRMPYDAFRSPALMAFGYAGLAPAGRYRVRYVEPPSNRSGWRGLELRLPSDPRTFADPGASAPTDGTRCTLIALPHTRNPGRVNGWVFLYFDFDRLLAEALGGLKTPFRLRIPSGSEPTNGTSPYRGRADVDLLGLPREIRVEGALPLQEAPGLFLPWLVLVAGLSLTGTACFAVWRLTLRRQEAESELDRIFQLSPDLLCVADFEGRFRRLNPAWEKVLGYATSELEGRRFTEWVHPDDVSATLAAMAELGKGHGVTDFMNRYRAKDGSWRWIEWNSTPYRGRLIYAAARDITAKRQAEADLLKTMEALKRNNRELQDFAFVASHDLQEPLRKIQAFGGFLEQDLAGNLSESAADYLARMTGAAARMQALIEGLLAYSRISTQGRPFERVDMDRILREVLSDLENLLERTGGRVESDPLPPLQADPLQMRQLLQNLVGNALKFHREGVPPVVKVRATMEETPMRYRLSVSDNGIGFEEKYLDRIFTVFQRLHGRGEYEGTGIGLAVCRRIVERHGGTITASSVPGQGSTFIVELPVGTAPGGDS